MPFGASERPLLDVEISGFEFPVKGLLDTGSVNTLFDRWIADEIGLDLTGSNHGVQTTIGLLRAQR